MEELYNKMQEYLNMDEEISFEEFSTYYKNVLETLTENHENFSEDEVWKGLFIVESVMSNAEARSKETKGSNAKKYAKMAQRFQLWAKNFAGRLHTLGYSDEQINERFEQMLEGEEPTQS
ncbi:hypothetical protein [Bacillus alkalicellulosilyticus]|uniref:hypothetical protein n=1 Tax=Alkalihalobacterium alkalicellulosilyticum TaxID=1912214 RepID=UPI00099787BC|nr:hypothetical protein [Bacillus alkalicellulosilyticus]